MKKRVVTIAVCCLSFLVICCIDPFNPPTTTTDYNYLVIDGFLNATEGKSTIVLTRTIPIKTDSAVRLEKDAKIELIDDHQNTVLFNEASDGVYTISNVNLNFNNKYKLKIVTSKNIEYQSEFVPIKTTPAIDSISHGYDRNGVPIYIYTHDAENNSHYYSWTYSETWAYNSAFDSYLKFDTDGKIVYTPEDTYHCWRSSNSSNILIGSSNGLTQDIISGMQINSIPWTSQKLMTKYSIEVEQHTLTREAFEYADLVRKNTENLGSLFDPLPSSAIGNFKCITDTDEIAIGFFTASTVVKKRAFIYANKLSTHRPAGTYPVTGYEYCQSDTSKLDEVMKGWPVSELYNGPTLIGYLTSEKSCVDCRLTGGTTTKPDFWDN